MYLRLANDMVKPKNSKIPIFDETNLSSNLLKCWRNCVCVLESKNNEEKQHKVGKESHVNAIELVNCSKHCKQVANTK